RHQHLGSQNERHGSREESDRDEQPAESLDDTRQAHQGEELRGPAGLSSKPTEPTEQLLNSVLHEEKSCEQAQDSDGGIGETSELLHGYLPVWGMWPGWPRLLPWVLRPQLPRRSSQGG